jgi:hypothetical protein
MYMVHYVCRIDHLQAVTAASPAGSVNSQTMIDFTTNAASIVLLLASTSVGTVVNTLDPARDQCYDFVNIFA